MPFPNSISNVYTRNAIRLLRYQVQFTLPLFETDESTARKGDISNGRKQRRRSWAVWREQPRKDQDSEENTWVKGREGGRNYEGVNSVLEIMTVRLRKPLVTEKYGSVVIKLSPWRAWRFSWKLRVDESFSYSRVPARRLWK